MARAESGDGDEGIQAPAGHEAGDCSKYSRNVDTLSARAGAKLMYHNDRVQRVMAVTDSVGSFVEWIER